MIKLWNLSTGHSIRIIKAPANGHRVHSLVANFHTQQALSASDDEDLKLWDLESGRYLRTFKVYNYKEHSYEEVWSIAAKLTPITVEAMLASLSHGGTLNLWRFCPNATDCDSDGEFTNTTNSTTTNTTTNNTITTPTTIPTTTQPVGGGKVHNGTHTPKSIISCSRHQFVWSQLSYVWLMLFMLPFPQVSW